MPRGNKNIGEYNAKRTPKKRKENASKAGKASQVAQAAKRSLREHMQALLESKVGNKEDGTPITGAEAMALSAFKAALDNDWKAWELTRDTSGNKPVDKVMVAEVDNETINEIENMVLGK